MITTEATVAEAPEEVTSGDAAGRRCMGGAARAGFLMLLASSLNRTGASGPIP